MLYSHCYNRTIDSSLMCSSDQNYIYLIELMTKKIEKYEIKIIAYCLMPNHYHFLISTMEKIQISKYIQSCFNSYVQAFNKQQNRKGPLFEGKVKIKIMIKKNISSIFVDISI